MRSQFSKVLKFDLHKYTVCWYGVIKMQFGQSAWALIRFTADVEGLNVFSVLHRAGTPIK
jgi:hypothetical protein